MPPSICIKTMKKTLIAFLSILLAGFSMSSKPLSEIVARDPFIYADVKSGWYYLYKQKPLSPESPTGGVEIYKSRDLMDWEGPVPVMTIPADNWITGTIWAPEMHYYKGKYYIFGTVNTGLTWKGTRPEWPPYTYRGTQTFSSKSPEGPFCPVNKDGPVPPMTDMTLDGTLWVEDGIPYMVYCHEWVDVTDGTIEYVRMSKDLGRSMSEPRVLFHASSAKWSNGDPDKYGTHYVSDGPFFYKSKTGELLMIWSSFSQGRYAIGLARSVTGRLAGPWVHEDEPINKEDGGHGSIFKTFDGRLAIVFHTPNFNSPAHPVIYELIDEGSRLRIGDVISR